MSFSDYKITPADVTAHGMQSRPNKLTGSAAENKAAFDALVGEVVRERLNGLIDALAHPTAASELGTAAMAGYGADNVQSALEELAEAIRTVTVAGLSPGAVSTEYLAPGAVTGEKLAPTVLPRSVGIRMGTAEPTPAAVAPGQIYLKYEA